MDRTLKHIVTANKDNNLLEQWRSFLLKSSNFGDHNSDFVFIA